MSGPTANLQTRFTVAQAATMMNVSVRSVYKAKALIKTGREDLIAAVEAGNLAIDRALKLAMPERYKPRDGLAALTRAWCAASEDERTTFLRLVDRGAP
jgi:hypothetical protein